MELDLKGKVAMVCAASRGLGKGTAMALAREGVNVAICARKETELHATAQEIHEETGVTALPIVCDLGSGSDIAGFVNQTIEQFSKVDILVTNIAHPKSGGFFSLSEPDWQSGFDNILLPILRISRLVLPHMKQQQWGRIINIASYVIKEPNAEYLLSGIFRTGIAVLGKGLANEFGRDGIRVNTVCPGLFHTDLGDGILEKIAQRDGTTVVEAEAKMAHMTATGEIGRVAELASYITFLSSDLANHITGQLLMVEGGKAKGLY